MHALLICKPEGIWRNRRWLHTERPRQTSRQAGRPKEAFEQRRKLHSRVRKEDHVFLMLSYLSFYSRPQSKLA